ncbi:MAG: hypothetical protein GY952_14010 [Rhodobacteraceae bacterium]|nr:hypothetical protein [Paracoccaceae bacterium]
MGQSQTIRAIFKNMTGERAFYCDGQEQMDQGQRDRLTKLKAALRCHSNDGLLDYHIVWIETTQEILNMNRLELADLLEEVEKNTNSTAKPNP